MKTIPWKHQQEEYDRHNLDEARALLWEPRTGKTKPMIDLACFLYQMSEIDGVILIAPNGVHMNWTHNQLPVHHWDEVPYDAFAWRFQDKQNADKFEVFMSAKGFAWFSTNIESLIRDENKKAILRFLRSRPKVLLIVDESHHFGQPGSKRTKKIRSLARHALYRRILTGTPIEDSPRQSYSQFQILYDGALGHSTAEDFDTEFVEYGTHKARGRFYQSIDGYKNLEVLRKRIAKYSSVVLRANCEELQKPIEDTRAVDLAPKTRQLWRDIKNSVPRVLLGYGFQEPPVGGALSIKLHQIEGGFLKTPNGLVCLDDNAKLSVVLDEVKGYTFLVFCSYLHEVDYVATNLINRGFNVGVIHGTAPNRAETIANFQFGLLDGLVMQSQCAAEGYDLNAADKIIWYSQSHTARIRVQGNQRATAKGDKAKQIVNIAVPGGVDEGYMRLTDGKSETADDVAGEGLKEFLERLDV